MIRHVVLFTWKPDFTPTQQAAWMDSVRQLPSHIPAIRSLSIGSDLMRSERACDCALVMDFDTLEDVVAYGVHPAHLPIIEVSKAGAAAVASVDFEVPTESGT